MLRTAGPTLSALLLVATLAACSGDEPDDGAAPGPDATVAALVDGLSSGDLAAVPFFETTAAEATADLAEVVEGMGEIEPTVEPGDVSADGDDATALVAWSWPLSETETWDYQSEVTLRRVDDEWQVLWGHQVVEPSLNANSVLETTPIGASRGDILGADGVALVTERAVVRVGIDRARVSTANAGRSAAALARLVGVEAGPFVTQVETAGPRAFVEAITYRQDELPPRVLRGYEAIGGAVLDARDEPLAVSRGFAAPILGTVGPVTAEMIAEEPERYEPGDVAGLSGLQARYDDQLQGTPGTVVNAVGSDGKDREIFRTGGAEGKALQLTLDERLQSEAEAILSDTGPASALVAVRPSDGAILAAANGPGADGQNIATFGQYAPGSTFKAVTSLALLRRGLTPDTPIPCTTTIDVDGRDFENYDDYPAGATGDIPFRTALANSCNTAFIAERGKLREGDLAAAAATLGLGIDHDLGFPAFFGSVEPPTSETGRAADMIGQGTVLASPMAMATVIASVQVGRTVVPRLVEQVEVSVPEEATPLSAGEARALKGLLRAVVTDGSGRRLGSLPGGDVIAKTGTAEFEQGGRTRTHAWMVAAQDDLAVAVFVQEGPSGSGTAGPLLEEFLRAAR